MTVVGAFAFNSTAAVPSKFMSLLDQSRTFNTEASPATVLLAEAQSLAVKTTDPITASMCRLLQADILFTTYSYNRGKYDRRETLPGAPSPDFTEWSGQQFCDSIATLLEQALASPAPLLNTPLSEWSDAIDADQYSRMFYPSMYDMIATRAARLLSNIDRHPRVYPVSIMSAQYLHQPLPALFPSGDFKRRAHNIYLDIARLNPNRIPPRVMAEINDAMLLSSMAVDTYSCDSLLLDIYARYSSTEWGGEALAHLSETSTRRAVEALTQAIDRFPHYFHVDNLRRLLAEATLPTTEISTPSAVLPDTPFKVKITMRNTSRATVNIYKSTGTQRKISRNAKPIFTTSITIPEQALPFSVDTVITASVPSTGSYLCNVSIPGTTPAQNVDNSPSEILATHIASLSYSLSNKVYPVAVDLQSGAPLRDVSVDFTTGRDNTTLGSATTTIDGFTPSPFAHNQGNYSLTFKRGNDSMRTASVYLHTPSTDRKAHFEAELFTSLPLYHHGDTVRWAGVIYSVKNRQRHSAPKGLKRNAILRDANYKPIDTLVVTTDPSGRVTGLFALPAEGLSGNFSISLEDSGSVGFQVNDYRLPTFEIPIPSIKLSNNPSEAVTISCRPVTYSGFPLPGCKVQLTLQSVKRSRWSIYGSTTPFHAIDGLTDRDGNASFTIPANVLALATWPGGIFNARIAVTSPAGETVTTNRYFTTGKPCYVSLSSSRLGELDLNNNPTSFNIDKGLQLPVHLMDMNDNPVNKPLMVTIARGGKSATFPLDNIDTDRLKPGQYDITVAPVDTTLADPLKLSGIILYRTKGPSPVDTPLWLPSIDNEITASGTYRLYYASGVDNAHILAVTTMDGDSIISAQWLRPGKGMHHLDIPVPAHCSQVNLSLMTQHDGSLLEDGITIKNSLTHPRLEITTERFRDHVNAGGRETLTLKVTRDNNPVVASILAVMQSRSILALHDNRFDLSNPRYYFPTISLAGDLYRQRSSSASASMPDFNTIDFAAPSLKFNNSILDISAGQGPLRGMRIRSTGRGEEMKLSMAAAKMDAASNEALLSTADAGTNESAPDGAKKEPLSVRPSEIPLAFFAPMLSTDSMGRLTYLYALPPSNTEWLLRTVAYTPTMETAAMERKIVASRPLMVQTAAPRFLRYGDSLTLSSMVMNNTDSTIVATSHSSLTNPLDGTIVATATVIDTIAPRAIATVTLPYTATPGISGLVYKVIAETATTSDGEQRLIDILPATQPVVKSIPLFFPADSAEVSTTLSRPDDSATSTLYLYTNPLWELLNTIPSLLTPQAATASQAAANLYTAAMLRNILASHPAVAKALNDWIESDRSGSTMVSMLERNDDLKQILLGSTPWAREAMSPKARLDRLAFLANKKDLDDIIAQSIKTLEGCSTPSGAISWTPGSNYPSQWVTESVLTVAAKLASCSALPSSTALRNILVKAQQYVDSETWNTFVKNGRKGYYPAYSLTRSQLAIIPASAHSKAIVTSTVQAILKKKNRNDILPMALDAQILHLNGYKLSARQLAKEIEARAITSATKGTWWRGIDEQGEAVILNSLHLVGLNNSNSGIVQWLLINKTANDATSAMTRITVADALFNVIDTRVAISSTGNATLDGKVIENDAPTLPGLLVANISTPLANGDTHLTIDKPTGLPAFGSVIEHSTPHVSTIQAAAHPSVSISKLVAVTRGTELYSADTLSPGDRIVSTLTVKVTDELDYITIIDRRAACLEPSEQLSGYYSQDGLSCYREVTDTETRYYITTARPGTYRLSTTSRVTLPGRFSAGAATLQSEINPGIAANSSTSTFIVNEH